MLFAGIAITQLEKIHPQDPRKEEAFSSIDDWIRKTRACLQSMKCIEGMQGVSHAA
jgi:hypothetical protein